MFAYFFLPVVELIAPDLVCSVSDRSAFDDWFIPNHGALSVALAGGLRKTLRTAQMTDQSAQTFSR